MSVTLYHFPPSFYSQIVRLALVEKGIQWQSRYINIGPALENYQPWYLRLNPKGVIPTLEHDGRIISDSLHIIHYLEQAFPQPALMPDTESETQEVEQCLEELNRYPEREHAYGHPPRLMRSIIKHSFGIRRKKLLKYQYNNPDLHEQYQWILDDLQVWENSSQTPAVLQTISEQLDRLLANLEQRLSDGRKWYIGEHYTLADVVWTVFLARIKLHGELQRYKDKCFVADYYRRLKQRPSFKQADIWEHIKPLVMLPVMLRYFFTRK